MKTPWRIAVLLPLAALCLTGCIKPEKEVLTVQTTRIEMPAHQSTPFLFEIWANFLWTIETADSWLYVNLNQAYGDKVIEVSVSPNTSLSPRTTRFHIAGTSARQTVEVIQLGEEPTITFKNSSMTVSADGGTAEMEVSTNVEVNLSIDVPWVKFVSTRLISSSIYSFQVEQNTGLTPRTAKITFSQRNGPLRQELTITQTGEAPAIVPSRTVVSVGATGGDQMLTISSNVPYTASCPDDWVVIIPTKLMTEDVFFFNVRPNPRVETRETELIFTGPGSPPTAVASLLVRQDGAAAVATFFPTQYINVPAIASVDKYRVDVAANFNWTVDFSKTDPWVTGITFDAHSCSFNVLANNEMSLRTTTIVFRQTGVLEANAYVREYTISQQAASPQLSFLPLQANMPELSGDRDSVLVLVTANLPWVQQIDQNWASFEERHVNGLPANTRAFMLKVQENTAS
ncbi:MAG: BACON domain-containing protein, partial [Bacteroidales bacterium]|nr:BACON domain-containing protein [Bacteroidales bacterium]